MTTAAPLTGSPITKPRPVERALAITVLMGGPSEEREVSLQSGEAIASALESLGHQVRRSDIGPDDLTALDAPMDLAFIALHGTFGEDGQIQRILEGKNIRYTGSDAAASSRAMSKLESKSAFIKAGLPTPRFDVIRKNRIAEAISRWTPPAVVKPVAQGSSVDCYIIKKAEDLGSAVDKVVDAYGECLIEEYIDGAELTVGIVGEDVLPAIEIRTQREFYNYEAKYIDDTTEYLFDIDLPAEVLASMSDLSLAAHHALGCRHMSRVDWMVRADTHEPFLLEINTIPGCTSHSLLPKAAKKAGLTFPELCQRIVEQTMSD
jgi:D-alanine-D-alanine ligase